MKRDKNKQIVKAIKSYYKTTSWALMTKAQFVAILEAAE